MMIFKIELDPDRAWSTREEPSYYELRYKDYGYHMVHLTNDANGTPRERLLTSYTNLDNMQHWWINAVGRREWRIIERNTKEIEEEE